MGSVYRHGSTIAALVIAGLLIVGAYLVAKGNAGPSAARASEETALLQAIATRDSTGDGLPDWEKSLYGIPLTATTTDYFHTGMTDGEAVAKGLIVPKALTPNTPATSAPGTVVDPSLPPAPAEGTLTDAFAKNFFTLYLDAKQANGGAALTEAQTSQIANQAITELSQAITAAPDYKAIGDLTVSGSGPDALKSFAIAAEAVSEKNTANASKSELLYLRDAVQNQDASAIPHIVSLAESYQQTAVGLAALPVPTELAQTDLALINALMRMSQVTSDFARVTSDPLATMLALQQYPQVILNLGNAFIAVSNAYKTDGVVLPDGTPGATFVNLVPDIAKEQAVSGGPKP